MKQLQGILPILTTPFLPDSSLDVGSLRRLVSYYVKMGVNGVVPLGFMSEVTKLSDEERRRVIKTVVSEVNSRIPVITGIYHVSTSVAIEYGVVAEKLGSDYLLVPPPKLAKPSDEALIQHFQSVAEAVKIPIVLQDEPNNTGVHMSIELIEKVSHKVESAQYIKLEDPPTNIKITQLRKLIGDKLGIFGGMGGMYFVDELKRGSAGIMTAFSYPHLLIEVYRLFKSGKRKDAYTQFYRYLPLISLESTPGIGLPIRKELLRRRKIFTSSHVRPPSMKLDSQGMAEIDEILTMLGPDSA